MKHCQPLILITHFLQQNCSLLLFIVIIHLDRQFYKNTERRRCQIHPPPQKKNRRKKKHYLRGTHRVIVIVIEKGMANRVQALHEAVCISHSADSLLKGLNQTTLFSSVRLMGLFNHDIMTGLGEGKFWIQTCETRLKTDLASHPARTKELGKFIQKYHPKYILRN